MNILKNIRQTLILSAIIMMAMMPLRAFSAIGIQSFAWLKSTIETSDPNSKLELVLLIDINFNNDIEELETITVDQGKDVTLYTNTYNITCNSPKYLFHISEGATLTITNIDEPTESNISGTKFAEVIDGSTLNLGRVTINSTEQDWIVAKKVNGESGGTINIIGSGTGNESTIKYNNTFCNLKDGSTLNINYSCNFEAQDTNDQAFSLITTDDNNLSRVHIDYGYYIDTPNQNELTEDNITEWMNENKTFAVVKDNNVYTSCDADPDDSHALQCKGEKATCTQQGKEDYYQCVFCSRCFEDENGTKPFYRYHVVKTLPLKPHNYDETTDRCTSCGELKESKDIVDGEEYKHKYRPEYETFKKFTYRRTFTEKQVGKWQALYIPFKLEYNDWKDGYDVAAINNFHEYFDESGNVVKRELEVCLINNGRLYANTPYLIRPKAAGEMVIERENADVYGAYEIGLNCQSTNRYYGFEGTYHSISGLKEKDYIFLSDGMLCKAKTDEATLKPQRWYLTIEDMFPLWEADNTEGSDDSAVMNMPIRVIGENDATGIEEIKVKKTVLSSDGTQASEIYDINGCRMKSMKSGVNIVRMADGRVIKMTVK